MAHILSVDDNDGTLNQALADEAREKHGAKSTPEKEKNTLAAGTHEEAEQQKEC